MTNLKENHLLSYYIKFKELVELHRKYEFGDAPRSSEGFTEAICCFLYNLEKASNIKREFDLQDPVSKIKIEVKGTSDDYGRTTINPKAKFDWLYWVQFKFEFNIFHVIKIPYEAFNSLHASNSKKRIPITLSKFKHDSAKSDFYYFNTTEMKMDKISVRQYLDKLKNKSAA